MACHKKESPPEYKTSVTYVSDGRGAMWHLPFPFLHPSDIQVRLVDSLGLEHELTTPNGFIAYWDYIVCVVPVGWRIRISLIPPLEVVLAGITSQKKTKQILDRHKIKAIGPDQYASESEDGSYDELSEDVEGIEHDVPFPDLQNDRLVMIEGDPKNAPISADEDAQTCARVASCGCRPPLGHQSVGCACVSQCEPPREVRRPYDVPMWVPEGR